MGTILQAACPKCGLETELYIGGGMADCNPETALAVAGNHPGLTAALQNGAQFRIERCVSVCLRCRKPVAAARVTYQRPGAEKVILAPRCPECTKRLLWQPNEPKSITCPVCSHEIRLMTAGHWD